jgi:hypothetical protein
MYVFSFGTPCSFGLYFFSCGLLSLPFVVSSVCVCFFVVVLYLFVACLQQEFSKKYKDEIRKYGMMQRYDDSSSYLAEHPHLVCEETANCLVIWCIDLEVEEVWWKI